MTLKWVKAVTTFCSAALVALALAGCAPTATQEGTGGYIDDTVITTKVKSALLAEKSIKSTEISVETFKGRVQLSGFVTSRADAERAVSIAKGVKGVRQVENDMRVK